MIMNLAWLTFDLTEVVDTFIADGKLMSPHSIKIDEEWAEIVNGVHRKMLINIFTGSNSKQLKNVIIN